MSVVDKAVGKVKELYSPEYRKPAQLRRFAGKNRNKKLLPLKNVVRKPLLIAIAIINIAIVIFFNAAMLILLYATSLSEMNSIADTMENAGRVSKTTSEIDVNAVSEAFHVEVNRRSPVFKIGMIFIYGDGEINAGEMTLSETDTENMLRALSEADPDDNTPSVPLDRDILQLRRLNLPSGGETEVYLAVSQRELFSQIISSNEVLLVIIALSIVALMVASHIIAKNISEPIRSLSENMEVIGDGDVYSVPVSETSEELNKLTVSINEMLIKLQAYSAAHTSSLQNLSHDLRTPIMSISGYAEGIKYGVIEDKEMAADVIINESKRLAEVVEKMLILSELDTLNQPIDMIPTRLELFINDCVTGIQGYAMKRGVEIFCEFYDESAEVIADAQLLTTILENLLSNAIRYAESRVDIKVFTEEGDTVISVDDDGAGLSKEDLEHLFVRFYVGKTGHSGMGLSAAKSAAEYMGCTLRGENKKDGGAIFSVVFPKI